MCLRDYVKSWYHPLISGSTVLFDQAKDTTAKVLSDISRRCQEPELLPLLMEALVANLIDHFKLYKGARAQVVKGTFYSHICALSFSLLHFSLCLCYVFIITHSFVSLLIDRE